ncbi:hypothetical protein SHIRM173S_01116 [Streptomyces hirsutus]
MMPSTPRSRSRCIRSGSLTVHTCTWSPRAWAVRTKRRSTTGTPDWASGTWAATADRRTVTGTLRPRPEYSTPLVPYDVASRGPASRWARTTRASENEPRQTRSQASVRSISSRKGEAARP